MTLSILLFSIIGISMLILRADKSKRLYLLSLGIIGLLSFWTISRYVNPDFDIYTNADFHSLEELGIQFQDSLYLVNEYFPEMALYSQKSGQISLKVHEDSSHQLQIRSYDFHEPIFASLEEDPDVFQVQNAPYGVDISQGFELGRVWGESRTSRPWLKLRIQEHKNPDKAIHKKIKDLLKGENSPELRDSCTFAITFFRDSTGTDSLNYISRFSNRLNIGLELRSILRNIYKIELPDTLLSLIEDSYVLREKFYTDRSQVNESPLMLFPGKNLANSKGIYVKGKNRGRFWAHDFPKSRLIDFKENQKFFLGLGGTKATQTFHMTRRGAKISLFHDFPIRRELRTEGVQNSEQDLFISSSTIEILQNDYEAGYHFSKFEQDEHFLHFNGVVKYFLGETEDSLLFSVLDQFRNTIEPLPDTFLAGDTIPLSATGFRQFTYTKEGQNFTAIDVEEKKEYRILRTPMGITDSISLKTLRTDSKSAPLLSVKTPFWLFKFNNLRESNPLKTQHIFGLIFLVLALSFAVILLKPEENISKIEVLIYALLLGFLTIRLILLWRSGTFLPIEDLDLKIFNKLRSPLYFRDTLISISSFFLLIMGYHLLFHKYIDKLGFVQQVKNFSFIQVSRTGSSQEKKAKAWWEQHRNWLIAFASNWLLILLASLFFQGKLERFINIAFPVLGFFLLSIPIFQTWSKTRKNRAESVLENSLFWLLLLNWISTWSWLLLNDAGFSIVFVLFSALSAGFGLGLTAIKGDKIQWNRALMTLGIFGVIGLSIFYSTRLIDGLIEHADLAFWAGMIATSLVLAYFGFRLYKLRIKYPQTTRIAGITSATLLLTILVFSGGVLGGIFSHPGEKIKQDYTYIKYRAAIHNKSLEAISSEIEFESYKSRKLLEASQNQWFIDQLLQKDSDKYFTLRPHFNKGASYISQTTDLVILRYIIAEHSQWTVLGLVLLFGLLFGGIIYKSDLFNNSNLALAGIPLLLAIQGFFIWMTVTNRFAFFGQDFPLISMQSRMTLFFTLGLLLLPILFIKEEKTPIVAQVRYTNNNFYKLKNWLVLLLFVSIVPVLSKGGKRTGKAQSKGKNTRFTLGKTLQNTQAKLNKLNVDFQTFQRKTNFQDPDSLIKAFETWASEKGINSYTDIKHPQSEDQFTLSVWNHFVKQNERDKLDDPKQILHLRRPEAQYYEFAVNNNYYLLKAPEEFEKRWKGSLLSSNTGNIHRIVYRNQTGRPSVDIDKRNLRPNIFQKAGLKDKESSLSYLEEDINNITISSFPNIWTFDGKPLVLISIESGDLNSNKGNFSIVNDQFRISSKNNPGRSFAYRLESKDYVNLYDYQENPIQLKLVGSDNRYLAKNLWLNGKQELFFPLGSKSIWSYNYANLLAQSLNKDDSLQHKDVHVSIDYSLSEELYNIVEKYMKKNGAVDMSMVSLDQRGRIRAMIDYKKDPDSRFNPNNTREYSELFQKFYLESNRSTERTIFGNRCLQRLDNGPGSSIKPIMYTAVTSGINIDPWNSLEFVWPKTQEELETNLKERVVKRYAGHRMQGRWTLGPQDMDNSFDNIRYLSKSSNLYHSLIMFLGSYRKEDLMVLKGNSDIKRSRLGNILLPVQGELENRFPRIKFGENGKEYILNPDKKFWPQAPSGGIMSDLNSVLSNGLAENFDFEVQKPTDQARLKNPYFSPQKLPQDQLLESRSSYLLWSYPEKSHFYQIDRSGDLYDINGIRQSTVGGFPIEVTPLKMAEMGIRMASLNKDIKASLDTAGTQSFHPIQYDAETWKDFEQYQKFHARNTLSGLKEVLLSGTGTAFNPRGSKKRSKQKYYYYAKTGTIKGEKAKFDDHHLLFIISKKDLNKPNKKIDDADSQPMFAIYISYFNSRSRHAGLSNELIKAIEKSGIFTYQMQVSN